MAENKTPYIKVTKNGPYLVFGKPKIAEETIVVDEDGISIKYEEGKVFQIKGEGDKCTALCRCGHSKNSPYCDSTHNNVEWHSEETASFEPILENADSYKGKNYTLRDNDKYCAFARFCDAEGRIWNLIQKGEKEAEERAIREAWDCPAGRLIIVNKRGQVLEPNLEQEIGVLEDAGLKISGPLWVKGGIRVESADGKSYEVRNRQTLCRCGYSSNKPFCNGAHASTRWKAERKEG